jgi:SAM-dependent methyltransferase
MAEPKDVVLGEGEVRCPVCGGAEHVKWCDIFDDRYGHPGNFQLAQCRQCGHLMTLPRLREEDLPHLYGTYYPRKALTAELVARQAVQAQTRMARLSRWWMGGDNQGQFAVRPGEKMLDIGCGSGFSLLIARSRGAKAYGVEADPNVQALARELGLAIHQGSIHDHPFPGVSFDLVVLNQVIEHIPEPGLALEEIAGRLAPGGRIILVFPNRASLWRRLFGARWINWHIPYHLHHFDQRGLCRLAARHGLRLVRARTITPNLWTLLQLRVTRARSVRGQPSPVWRVAEPAAGGGTVGGHRSIRQRVKGMILALLLGGFGVFNRCIDLLGQGDCLMVELRREQDL